MCDVETFEQTCSVTYPLLWVFGV